MELGSDYQWTGVRGKRVVITGATSGIDLAAGKRLAALGAHVAIVARSRRRAAEAVREITSASGESSIEFLIADLASQVAVRRLAGGLARGRTRQRRLLRGQTASVAKRPGSGHGIRAAPVARERGADAIASSHGKPVCGIGRRRQINETN